MTTALFHFHPLHQTTPYRLTATLPPNYSIRHTRNMNGVISILHLNNLISITLSIAGLSVLKLKINLTAIKTITDFWEKTENSIPLNCCGRCVVSTGAVSTVKHNLLCTKHSLMAVHCTPLKQKQCQNENQQKLRLPTYPFFFHVTGYNATSNE